MGCYFSSYRSFDCPTDLKSCCFILSVPLLLFLLVSIHCSQCPGTELGTGGGVVVGVGGWMLGPGTSFSERKLIGWAQVSFLSISQILKMLSAP